MAGGKGETGGHRHSLLSCRYLWKRSRFPIFSKRMDRLCPILRLSMEERRYESRRLPLQHEGSHERGGGDATHARSRVSRIRQGLRTLVLTHVGVSCCPRPRALGRIQRQLGEEEAHRRGVSKKISRTSMAGDPRRYKPLCGCGACRFSGKCAEGQPRLGVPRLLSEHRE